MISRWLGILLLVASIAAVTAWPVQTAQAQEEEDEDEADDDDDGGDDGTGVEEEDEDEKDQPAVTAGGLFTMKSFPVRELYRPLTMTEKIVQARLGLGVDVAAQTAFENWGLSLDAKYGARDHVMLLAGFDNAYNFKQFAFYGGIEAGLAYDFIDFRATARVSQGAIRDVMPPSEEGGRPIVEYAEGRGIKFAIDLGFPFRYRATKEIAIIALDTFMSIDFNEVGRAPGPGVPPSPPTGCPRTQRGCGYNGVKPDLQPSIGIATNPIEAISLVLYAQLQVIDFNTEADAFVIPATARIQFSPSRVMDIGGEFTFINLKPGDPDGDGPLEAEKFYENRFFTLYANFRFGR